MTVIASPDFDGMPLDTTTIPQGLLNIESKERSNLFPWNAQFSPQLVEVLLKSYAPRGGFVLDPFLGSGTVLYEAGKLNHPAFGSEVNPAAFNLARVYTFINVNAKNRRNSLDEVSDILEDVLPSAASLFSDIARTPGPIPQMLVEAAMATHGDLCTILLQVLVILLDYGDRELTADAVRKTWKNLRNTVIALPNRESLIGLSNCDARKLPLSDRQADIVITSPPYVNVFNYHQQYRKSVEALGWNLLEVAKSEIGSNRKHRSNRFLTVIQYCLDMALVFAELRRVCKPDARLIFVVGRESNVRKTQFFNGEIVAQLATQSAGYRLEGRQERVFQNRFGEMIYEDILHLSVRPPKGPMTPPLEIAKAVLSAARARAPEESIADLLDAVEKLKEVTASPVYVKETALDCQPGSARKEFG